MIDRNKIVRFLKIKKVCMKKSILCGLFLSLFCLNLYAKEEHEQYTVKPEFERGIVDKVKNFFAEKYRRFQRSRLSRAIKKGNIKKVTFLIDDKKYLVNAADEYGLTPLHEAATNGQTEVAKLLLDNEAEVNAKDKFGYTPMDRAMVFEHKELTELLALHGGIISSLERNPLILNEWIKVKKNIRDQSKDTPSLAALHKAISN